MTQLADGSDQGESRHPGASDRSTTKPPVSGGHAS